MEGGPGLLWCITYSLLLAVLRYRRACQQAYLADGAMAMPSREGSSQRVSTPQMWLFAEEGEVLIRSTAPQRYCTCVCT